MGAKVCQELFQNDIDEANRVTELVHLPIIEASDSAIAEMRTAEAVYEQQIEDEFRHNDR